MKYIEPGTKLALKLTGEEQQLVCDLNYVERVHLDAINAVQLTGGSVMLDLGELDSLVGCVAAEANHEAARKRQRKLDRIIDKINKLLHTHTDESGS